MNIPTIAFLRTRNGEPDWAEDCLSADANGCIELYEDDDSATWAAMALVDRAAAAVHITAQSARIASLELEVKGLRERKFDVCIELICSLGRIYGLQLTDKTGGGLRITSGEGNGQWSTENVFSHCRFTLNDLLEYDAARQGEPT